MTIQEQNIAIMKETDAFLEGHFLLTSGRHSGGYCQCAKLLRFPDKAAKVLSTVVDQIKDLGITKVCGPPAGHREHLHRAQGRRDAAAPGLHRGRGGQDPHH